MISKLQFENELDLIIANAVREDVGDGDHSSLACIPSSAQGKAKLLVKDTGVLAGVAFAKRVFTYVDPDLKMEILLEDGAKVNHEDIAFYVEGASQSILKAERLVLNAMQRMSAIATKTAKYVKLLEGTGTKILDTRKTTPGIRALEKWAVKIGGGENHRFALYDMIMLKDNHIDFAGGIPQAIQKTKDYLKTTKKDLKIIVEARDLNEVQTILDCGGVHRILLDNFNYQESKRAVALIGDQCQTESSGGIDNQPFVSMLNVELIIFLLEPLPTPYRIWNLVEKPSSMSIEIEERLDKIPIVGYLVGLLKKIRLPGFERLSIYDLTEMYFIGVIKGALTDRASAIAYSFFLALFPFLLFILNLIPYVPMEGFQENFIVFIESLLPPQTVGFFDTIIEDIGKNQRGGLLSSAFLLSIFTMANGINAIFGGF